jgi:transcriptional accessory protein Tex/SPT6
MSPEYLAGFFDGEGTFYLGQQRKNDKVYPKAQVLLAQSGKEGLELFEKIRSEYGGTIYTHLVAGDHKATKDAYKMYWNKDEAIDLIQKLLPHLIIKHEAAKLVLNYLTRKSD